MPIDVTDPTLFTTYDGTVLRLRPVSATLVARRARAVPVPVPPMVDLGKGREEEHYGAPSYLIAMQEYEQKVTEVNMGTYYLLGISVEKLGPDTPGCEDKGWSSQLEDRATWGDQAMYVPPIGDRDARWIFWMTYIVLARDTDLTEVSRALRSLGGAISEEAVSEAVDSFRGSTNGPTDSGVATPNRAARRRDRSSK